MQKSKSLEKINSKLKIVRQNLYPKTQAAILLFVILFSVFYTFFHFFFFSNNYDIAFQSEVNWNNLLDSIDQYHVLVRGFLFLPLILTLLRVLFPKKLEKLGDYFFLATVTLYNLHSLSQIFLGTCILTFIGEWISIQVGIPSRYAIYVWNPLGIPEILLMPYYWVQLAIGFFASYKLGILINSKPKSET